MPTSRLAALALLWAFTALAHTRGVHKRETLSVDSTGIDVVLTMDFDSGPRCALLRAGADGNGDGQLSEAELKTLKASLEKLALSPLRLSVSSWVATPTVEQSKLDLRGDLRANDAGLSVAVLLRVPFPSPATPGMTLVVQDESPDRSHVELQVFQNVAADGGAPVAPFRATLTVGQRATVRLVRLAPLPSAAR